MQYIGKLVISLIIAAVAAMLATLLQGGTVPDPILLGCFALATVATTIAVSLLPAGSPTATGTRKAAASGTRKKAASSKAGREQGTVKWFNTSKGFGFITTDAGTEIFVHFRAIRGEGRRSLREGDRVAFNTADSDKGPQAEDVELLEKAA